MKSGGAARVLRRSDEEGGEIMSSPPPAWPGTGLRTELSGEEGSRPAALGPWGLGLGAWVMEGGALTLKTRQALGKTWPGWVGSLSPLPPAPLFLRTAAAITP